MKYTIIILCLLLLLVTAWLIHLKIQMLSLSKQLEKRLSDGSRNSIHTALLAPSAIRLAADINRCLEEDERKQQTLEREEKQFRDTIANISHDLRTPLTSIKGYVQLLEGTLTRPQQLERIRVIRKHTDELGDLIEHFFEYSCLLSDDSELTPEVFCLTDETAECLAAAVPQLEEKGLTVHLGEFGQVSVCADRERTVRIIQNLVRNCLQHAAGDISVNVTQRGGFAVLSVANPVRDPDRIDARRLFDRFYTGDKSRRKSTGLGLSIVKILAEQLGGDVSAELSGDTLTFTVRLPQLVISD